MACAPIRSSAASIKQSAHPDVNLIFGAQIDENMGDEVRITVIATGFEQSRVKTRMDQQLRPTGQQSQRPMQMQPAAQQPQQPQVRQQPQQPPAAQNPQQPQVRQQPQRPQQQDYSSRVYDEDDIDIPPFMRNKRS